MKTLTNYINESLASDSQKIFVILKPGFLDLAQEVIKKFNDNGWEMDKTVVKLLTPKEARDLYAVHKKKDFYKSLCEYMRSAPCRAFIFKKQGIQTNDVFKKVQIIKDEIRDKWGESEMRNVIHSSDSLDNMEKESRIFFRVV